MKCSSCPSELSSPGGSYPDASADRLFLLDHHHRCSFFKVQAAMPIPDLLPVPFPADADYTRQSFEIPGTRKPGQTGEPDVDV